eukprot:CAMPEP_0177760968 /NCGR_PEP_ID=MMETSP0491_2-20121128/5551_1 /TAXON_ID=63592 /ORGANISM="Tetraselmis chuii, Strain PLY429" /LENGTH=156 /DNA_ID=CAMNT_0019276905 /DNA_START=91 /DNA_END=558 /DNA_ORIENTATION=+
MDEHKASGLLVMRLLLETCHLNCNPSSLYQRLVRASDNTATNVQKMNEAKRHCLQGCNFAALPGTEPVVKASQALDVEAKDLKAIRDILDRDEKRAHIKRLENAVASVKDSCFLKCTRTCADYRHAVDSKGRKLFQAYDSEDCVLNCSNGCKQFTD